jgi:hypothetical protein
MRISVTTPVVSVLTQADDTSSELIKADAVEEKEGGRAIVAPCRAAGFILTDPQSASTSWFSHVRERTRI